MWIGKILLAGYAFLIKPGMKGKADAMKGRCYAHRGLHNRKAGVPENSMKAFANAVEKGVGIEFDVQLTKDGKVVVFHDASLKRVCGVDGLVQDHTYQELQAFGLMDTDERIPLLEDVLALTDGKIPLLVEIKSETFDTTVAEKTDALLRKYKGEYVIESFHPWILHWYKKITERSVVDSSL